MPPPNELHVDSILTNLSLKYMNEAFIADFVMPIIKVNKRSNLYPVYKKSDSYRIFQTSVGPKAQPNEVDWEVGTDNYSVADYALADYIPVESVDNADMPINPRVDTNEFLNEWLMLDREFRVAKLVFSPATYPASNRKKLEAAQQWGADGDAPIKDVQDAVEDCFMRANTLVFGELAWRKFRALPEVLDATKGATRNQAAGGGLASRAEIAELFEVENVLVGRARYVTSKRGQKVEAYSRIWGNHMAALHVKPRPSVKTITFGVSFQEMMKQTQTLFDPTRGAKGAEYVKVAYNCDEKIMAADLGYFIENVVPAAA